MPKKSSSLYFVEAYTANEGEPALSLEYGVLRWSSRDTDRPEVFVHTYLRPASMQRVRWLNASKEMKITRQLIENKGDLPEMDDMLSENYLDMKKIVCFDDSVEPYYTLSQRASDVISIKHVWEEIYEGNEKALSCSTVAQMCEFIGLPADNNENTNYTPLLKNLHQMAALWQILDEYMSNPKAKSLSQLSPGLQINYIWPLPASQEEWFESRPSSLNDLSAKDLSDFFSANIADRINWFEMNMYACDWIYKRPVLRATQELQSKKEICEFIFNHILSFKMQMWVLIFFSLYHHRSEFALKIAQAKGNFAALSPAVIVSFTSFIIENIEYFLNPQQKFGLIKALLDKSLQKNAMIPFEHYDYEAVEKQSHSDDPKLYPTNENCEIPCVKGIRSGYNVVYKRFEIKGSGKVREDYISGVNLHLNRVFSDAKNPFSDFWLPHPLQLWIQFILDVDFSAIKGPQRISDSDYLNSVRLSLRQLIEESTMPYLKDFFDKLNNAINMINQGAGANNGRPIQFAFQGCSFEIVIEPPSKLGILRNLFSLH